jgi:hypothetical protein
LGTSHILTSTYPQLFREWPGTGLSLPHFCHHSPAIFLADDSSGVGSRLCCAVVHRSPLRSPKTSLWSNDARLTFTSIGPKRRGGNVCAFAERTRRWPYWSSGEPRANHKREEAWLLDYLGLLDSVHCNHIPSSCPFSTWSLYSQLRYGHWCFSGKRIASDNGISGSVYGLTALLWGFGVSSGPETVFSPLYRRNGTPISDTSSQ